MITPDFLPCFWSFMHTTCRFLTKGMLFLQATQAVLTPREGELNVAICPSFRTLIVPSDVCRILSGSEILCQRTQDPAIRTVSEPQDFLLLKWIGPSQLIRCTMFNKFQIGIRHDTACYSSGSTMFHLRQPGKDSILEIVGMLRTTKL